MGYHDLFFKQTFSILEHAVDFLKQALPPEVTMGIDYATLVPESRPPKGTNPRNDRTDCQSRC